jgi:hypothetical protein
MNKLVTIFSRAAVCVAVAGIAALMLAAPSRATVYQLPFDATGGSLQTVNIDGTVSGPTTLGFTLRLNAVYTADPSSSVSGQLQFGVFDNMGNSLFYALTGGTAYAGDVGNTTLPGSTQPWLNTMIFMMPINQSELPILVASLVVSFGGLVPNLATINPTLSVDLPSGLFLSSVPIPAALPLFAMGLSVLGFLGWSGTRKALGISSQVPTSRPLS